MSAHSQVQAELDQLYRAESRTMLAALIRLLGDFDLAEEALQEAIEAALTKWPKEGLPRNPRAWLIGVGRNRGIDAIRKRARTTNELEIHQTPFDQESEFEQSADAVPDDDLRLIFTCCHPALAVEARLALTLREVCGLTTEEIGRAFLTNPTTISQRIVRAKSKIRQTRISFEVPGPDDLADRLDAVLQVVYLMYNEGYSASFGDTVTRADLSGEAIRLGQLLVRLIRDSETYGLLALMLLQESRRAARTDSDGDIVTLEQQDRSLWNQGHIDAGNRYLSDAVSMGEIGPYTIQASIAAVHSSAQSASDTDWSRIADLYGLLLRINPSPVIELNRAVAVAMAQGMTEGLAIIDSLNGVASMKSYGLYYAARADLLRRAGRMREASSDYQAALGLTQQEPERRYLDRRLKECRLNS